jgi:hypothetical protein
MLNEILGKYKNRKDSSSKDKTKEDNLDFLNEEENLSMCKRTQEVLDKYCTLYDEGGDKYSIKPLTKQYLNKKDRKIQEGKTTGKEWFDMKAPELTPELREDLKAINLRNVIDPSRFYKKMDRNNIPKFFQVGTIMDNIIEGKRNRLKKEEVKGRIAEEFLESDIVKNYSLKKFEELQTQRRKVGLKKLKLNKYKLNTRKKSRKSDFIVK